MGCASSSLVSGLPGAAGLTGTSAARRLSMRPHSLETRILQVDQVDTLLLEPVMGTQKEAPFVDGQLGIGDLSPSAIASLPKGSPYSDPDFPADNSSLGFLDTPAVQWSRPSDLGHDGPLWTGESRGRITPGSFDDRWLAEAIAAVLQRPALLDKMFESPVRGAARVRLWRFGRWEAVVVDDRLPLPHCIATTSEGELWPAVLEKAFAKIHGSYSALSGGDVLSGLEDMTGGISQRLVVPVGAADLYGQAYRPLDQAVRAGALITCSRARSSLPQIVEQEIVVSSVVGTRMALRGPQVCIHDEGAENVDHWMDLQDFVSVYTNITVTTLASGSEKLQVQEISGYWESGISAGGSRNNLEKFATNPQFVLTITQPDEQEETKDFGRCSLLLALMQEHRRSVCSCRPPLLPIACFIYKAESSEERLSAEYFLCVPEEVNTGPFINKREIAHRAELEPGSYIIVPATWKAGQQSAFLLRIYALRKITLKTLASYTPSCAMLPTWVPATDL